MQGALDARITAERSEHKLTLPRARARAFADALDARLERHRFTGEGANELPGAHHFVTTIYFDTPDRSVYRHAVGSDHHVKVRAKEYYDVHPSLTPLATHARELVRYRPLLWLEIKERRGATTAKQRVAVEKPEVPAWLDQHGLEASCLVNYRRLAWQSRDGELRITLDLSLSFYRPPDDLWSRREALVREALGAPAGDEPRAIVEVKSLGEVPGAISTLLDAAGAVPTSYSKFEFASRSVHG